jgi:hypothetical protein
MLPHNCTLHTLQRMKDEITRLGHAAADDKGVRIQQPRDAGQRRAEPVGDLAPDLPGDVITGLRGVGDHFGRAVRDVLCDPGLGIALHGVLGDLLLPVYFSSAPRLP